NDSVSMPLYSVEFEFILLTLNCMACCLSKAKEDLFPNVSCEEVEPCLGFQGLGFLWLVNLVPELPLALRTNARHREPSGLRWVRETTLESLGQRLPKRLHLSLRERLVFGDQGVDIVYECRDRLHVSP